MAKPELKYLIIKVADALDYLNEAEIGQLEHILGTISKGREKDGKNPDNEYLVVNRDEKYADQVWDIIVQNEKID